MVTSMAIPSATLKTSTVDGFKAMPTQPITPAVITKGIRLGINEHNNMRNERNKYNIQRVINKNAQKILSFNPLMIKPEPSKKLTLLPVNVT